MIEELRKHYNKIKEIFIVVVRDCKYLRMCWLIVYAPINVLEIYHLFCELAS